MVNNYVLICNNQIIDIFYNLLSPPIFAPYSLKGDAIDCILLDTIISDVPIEIGQYINDNLEVIEYQTLIMPDIEEDSSILIKSDIQEAIDNYTLELINKNLL